MARTPMLALCALFIMAGAGQAAAELRTVPPPAGIDREQIVSPGGSAVIYTVGLRGSGHKARLTRIDIAISPLAAPRSAQLRQADFAQLRLIESANATLGDGDDVLLNTVPQGSIEVSGGVTSITDGGNATLLGTSPPPAPDRFRFYFIVADMSADAVTGNAFRLGAAANHIATSVPSTIGAAIAARNADRVVIDKLVPVTGLSPASLGFGQVRVFSSASLGLTVTNTGAATLNVTRTASSDGQFVPDIASFSVPPGGSQVVHVRFTPTSPGPKAATLSFTHNDTLPSIVTTVPLNGTGTSPATSPAIGVTPSTLAFGEVPLATPSTLSVTVANTGDAILNVTNITSSSGRFVPDATSFAVAPGGSRVIRVTFTPTGTGARSATLSIVHDDRLRGSPTTVALSGTGINPIIGVSPASLAFGTVQVGATASQSLTIANTGTTDLVVTSVTSSEAQFVPDRTSFTVPRRGSQVVQVVFAPVAGGNHSGVLSLSHNAGGNPTTVALSGTGADPGIAVSPASLSFGSVVLGSASSLVLTIANTGTATLNASQVASSDGQFVPDLTSFSVAPGAQRLVTVTFTPSAIGIQVAALAISHNAAGSPATVALAGTGTGADVGLSPPALSFGDVALGSSSSLGLTVTNTGAATLSVTSITSSDGQFVPGLTAFSVAPGGNRVVDITFTPAASGGQSGAVTIAHNAAGSPARVPVDGTGTSPVIGVSPGSLSFGEVVVGSSSALSLVVHNTGTADLGVTSITADDGQFVPSLSAFSVAPGGSRELEVTFTPASTGVHSGVLRIAHTASGSPAEILLDGTGVAPAIAVSPAALGYGEVAVGASSSLTLTVANPGTAALSVTSTTADDGQFTPDISAFSVAPGGHQDVDVTFRPGTAGTWSGTLWIVHNAARSPTTIALSGAGTSPEFNLAPPALSFGKVLLGSSSSLSLTIANPGNRPLEVTNITSNSGQFVPDRAAFSVAPGSSQVVGVTFTPADTGAQSGALTISHSAAGSPGVVPVTGTGANPGVEVSAAALDFGNVTFGTTTSRSLTITNIGQASLTVADISSSDPQFVPDITSCTIAPGASQTITTTFSASSLGTKTGILFIAHDAAGGFAQVPMKGDATVAIPQVALDFGNEPVRSSAILPVTVTNPSLAPVTITRVVSSDPQFVPDLTTFVIPPGESRTIAVTFTPAGPGLHTATLSITHNPTITVTLSGVGAGGAEEVPARGGDRPRLEVPFGGEELMALAVCLAGLLWRRRG